MLNGLSYRDRNIVSRSFRFMSPNVKDPNKIFKNVDYDLETSYFSTAVGDNRYINPLPGYGFNTDPSPALVQTNSIKNKLGNMGRYYKRIHDDNATILTLTAGTAEFTGILQYITNMFDYSASTIANKGRAPTWAFYITESMASIAFWPFQLIGTGMNFLAYLFDMPKNQWYYVKPAMGQYLQTAQGIFNDLMVSAGYAITAFDDSRQESGNEARNSRDFFNGTINGYEADTPYEAKKANVSYMNAMFPDAINKDGTIDIVKLIGRGPRKYRRFLMELKKLDTKVGRQISKATKDKLVEGVLDGLVKDPSFMAGKTGEGATKGTNDYLQAELKTTGLHRGMDEISNPEVASSFYNADVARSIVPKDASGNELEEFTQSKAADLKNVADVGKRYNYLGFNSNTSETAPNTGAFSAASTATRQMGGTIPLGDININSDISQESWLGQISEILKDSFMGGMDSLSVRVEGGVGPVSDSMSNSTQQSEIAGFFNGTVQAINNFKFNVQGGNIGIPLVDGILNRIKDGAAGIASGSVIGNVPMALMGNSKMIAPEHWADSATSLHSESYTIYSECLYGHPYNIATAILLPIALIAPFVFPIATGGGTYSTPFMCKAFSRGRTIIKTGIVRNASFTFGEGELGWTKDRKPLNVRINLEIADLDPITAIPVTRMRNPLDVVNVTRLTSNYMGDIGKYNDWVARVTGVDYLDTLLKYNRLNKMVTRMSNDFTQMFSPSYIAGGINDSVVGDVGRLFTTRPLNR